ncbi:unnamed protein product [Mytilus edulis]|uniref:Reverse transcriptase domain-containing protein n=1 Tax=Mytilus edulis TaxID=6550 RepID=A0A8S3TYJ9_MYTED|nr:unnamed protein product [Mytilus edulis]
MNKARKVLRSAQRRAHASKRNTLTEKIMQASQNDSKLFHKLVNGQRKCNNNLTDTMVFKGIEESDPELMMSGWKDYFENLYKLDNLNNNQNFCTEKLRVIEVQNKIIEELETERNIEIDNTNVLEVQEVIKALKTGKSPGPDGLSAEHFKLMPEELLTYIVQIVNLIFKDKDLPQETKEGVVSPVHKSGKDKLHPENYRGITVTNTFSTLIEGILKDRLEPKLLKVQSKLQRGFTEKTSSLNTAFIVSAAADFYKEIIEELILLTLDAQKAFDKLHHEILFNKMYHDGIVGNMWLLLRNMYRNVTVKVKWNNSISDKFTQEIGVRQGAKLSTVLYKRYNNNILEALERSNIGARIGNINVVAPTCADDIAILASKEHEVQALLDIVNDMTNKDFVAINPAKSEIVPLTKVQQQLNVYLGDKKIDEKNEVKHLGLIRTIKNKVNIEDRLKVARRTIYAMLGPGLSARKGMSPIVSARLWQTYALPRSLYGIEVLNYTKSDITKLERLQLQICRQIQGLPKRVASAANYCLLGIEPIQSTVDRLLLNFFGGIIQDNTSIEYRIIERQLVMSKQTANTFISRLETALSKYKLPKTSRTAISQTN